MNHTAVTEYGPSIESVTPKINTVQDRLRHVDHSSGQAQPYRTVMFSFHVELLLLALTLVKIEQTDFKA